LPLLTASASFLALIGLFRRKYNDTLLQTTQRGDERIVKTGLRNISALDRHIFLWFYSACNTPSENNRMAVIGGTIVCG